MTKTSLILAGVLLASMSLAPAAGADDVPACKDVEDESLGVVDGDGGIVVDGEDSGLWEDTNDERIDGIQTEAGTCEDRTGLVKYDADTKVAP